MLPDKIPLLEVAIGDNRSAGQLLKRSLYEFRYLSPAVHQPSVALLMPADTRLTWQDGDLFPSMDQNLPEGDLLEHRQESRHQDAKPRTFRRWSTAGTRSIRPTKRS